MYLVLHLMWCVDNNNNNWYGYGYGMHALTQVYVTIRMDDAYTLNCRPTVPVGCEEQIVDAKCTRPLVKGLAPRLINRGVRLC